MARDGARWPEMARDDARWRELRLWWRGRDKQPPPARARSELSIAVEWQNGGMVEW